MNYLSYMYSEKPYLEDFRIQRISPVLARGRTSGMLTLKPTLLLPTSLFCQTCSSPSTLIPLWSLSFLTFTRSPRHHIAFIISTIPLKLAITRFVQSYKPLKYPIVSLLLLKRPMTILFPPFYQILSSGWSSPRPCSTHSFSILQALGLWYCFCYILITQVSVSRCLIYYFSWFLLLFFKLSCH